jgi:RimJ/RimL family protein N-acetyltransferase
MVARMGQPVLRTERLVLRPWRDEDLEPFAAMNADPAVREYFPSTLSRAQSDALARRIRAEIQRDGYGPWAVEVPGLAPDVGSFVGFIGLAVPSFEAAFTPCVEIEWRLARHVWGRGFATEGARAAATFAFDQLGLDEIVAMTATANLKSRRVMEKLGMRRDPADDFEHPLLPPESPLRRHVLYRLRRRPRNESC